MHPTSTQNRCLAPVDTLSDPLSRIQDLARQARKRAEQRLSEVPCQMYLPGFNIGTMPNHLNRSSLIAPIARGRRKFHRQTVMVTRRDCVLIYTGEQLDEADGDIIMALIFFAQPYPLGTPVPLNRAKLLKKIERHTGRNDYKWLHRRIKALTEATLFLEAKRRDGSTRYKIGPTVAFHIISSFHEDDVTGTYTYTLDPRWVQIFSNREYSIIDWNKRMQIRRSQDKAKTLQRLLATSADPVQRYALDALKAQMQSTSPMRKFRTALEAAARELKRLDIIAKWRIENSTRNKPQLVMWRLPSG